MRTKWLGAAAVALFAAQPAGAQTEIQFWHAMGGQLGEALNELAAGFNKRQKDYVIKPVYKGTYTETMTGAIAAFRARQHPTIVQVFEVGTANMMAAKGAIKPVYEIMAEAQEPFDPKAYLGAVYAYYSTTDGKLLSLPFNSSSPVLYWNKAAFQKAGLDPEKPPQTWPEMGEVSKKLLDSGMKCGFSSGWPSWIQIENFGAWHNVPFATKQNGFGGFDIQLTINDPVRVKHIAQLGEWHKTGIFVYGGRENKPNAKFSSGECGMFMGSTGLAGGFERTMKDPFGMTVLPYWPDVAGAPQNGVLGGATLWVLSGKSAAEYKGVAKFFSYLSDTEVQAAWHQKTGYVPITLAAYELSKKQGFYEKQPGRDISVKYLNNKPPTEHTKGLRIGNFVQIRDIIDEELEQVWAGKKTAKQALDDAVKRGNEQLRAFEAQNK